MAKFFTDRENGLRPRIAITIDERVWGGFFSLISARINDDSFGAAFPAQCPDGYGTCGCDQSDFGRMLAAKLPGVVWPLSANHLPDTPDILDLLEFCASAAGQPIQGNYHSFYRHHHLSWNKAEGLARFVAEINQIFERNGLAFSMDDVGEIHRILPPVLAGQLGSSSFKTDDSETDRLLELAMKMVTSPKL